MPLVGGGRPAIDATWYCTVPTSVHAGVAENLRFGRHDVDSWLFGLETAAIDGAPQAFWKGVEKGQGKGEGADQSWTANLAEAVCRFSHKLIGELAMF